MAVTISLTLHAEAYQKEEYLRPTSYVSTNMRIYSSWLHVYMWKLPSFFMIDFKVIFVIPSHLSPTSANPSSQ